MNFRVYKSFFILWASGSNSIFHSELTFLGAFLIEVNAQFWHTWHYIFTLDATTANNSYQWGWEKYENWINVKPLKRVCCGKTHVKYRAFYIERFTRAKQCITIYLAYTENLHNLFEKKINRVSIYHFLRIKSCHRFKFIFKEVCKPWALSSASNKKNHDWYVFIQPNIVDCY
jgi:hypothetical protein